MTAQTPRWLPWLSPLSAMAGAWLIGIEALHGGFWTVLFVALVCALLPAMAYRLVIRFRSRPSQDLSGDPSRGLSQGS